MRKNIFLVLPFILFLVMSCNNLPKEYRSYEEYPVYEGDDLEVVYTPEKTLFRVWSPAAAKVKVNLYTEGLGGEPFEVKELEYDVDGTWVTVIEDNLKGKFYTFQIFQNEQWLAETPGIWAKAVGVNGNRGAIIDMAETNPKGWEKVQRPAMKHFTDASIYELHVRDFSVGPESGMENKGKFLAFTEMGTTNAAGKKTGVDHLKELGITHVQLLPIYDYASVDETTLDKNQYNWGYDPKNYNVPEGGYSTDPYNPISRILEFKQAVQSLKNNGFRVIMDVVYNHTFWGVESHLNLMAPGYFYRFKEDGSWSNASGCGNETASDRAMMRRYIIESCKYWVTEYKVDGFRFDLMGIHDIETLNLLRAELDKIDPTISIHGEGWTAEWDFPLPYEKRAIKQNALQLDNIAVFSDDIRDGIRGTWDNNKVAGFIAGVYGYEESIKFGVVGATQHNQIHYDAVKYAKAPYANNPTQVINYASCHDDLSLHDKIIYSAPEGTSDKEKTRFNKLAQAIVFTAQGVPFIYGGEELKRDKQRVHNTYQSPDSINQIDWSFKTTNHDMFDYYRNLIELRRTHPAFRMPTQEMVQKHLQFINVKEPALVAYTISGNANGDSWRRILVIYNGNRHNVTLDIPQENWVVVANGEEIDLHGIFKHKKAYISVPASSAMILYAD
ncbi:MAG: type I pullulanase [Paludibacteraceae bacterium]|nr:type I pullulanase [Paludibacteraceae bacterium]MBP6283864.1 type I pullulanase [Paludibacteraceae bacterium]